MNKRVLVSAVVLLIFAFPPLSYALSEKERALSAAAGEYYAAIMLAKKFKGTRCGNISIDKKWMDLDRAKRDIFAKLPRRMHKEMEQDWEKLDSFTRTEVRQLVAELNSEKAVKAGCDKVQGLFWTEFDRAVKQWQRY